MRNGLVVVQVSMSLVLLIGSGLFLRSLQNAASIDIGMRPENVLLMAVDPKLHSYTPEKSRQFIAQLRERVEALPGVRSVTYVDSLPLSIGGTSFNLQVLGSSKEQNADIYNVGARYFDTMGMPLLRGRDFDRKSDKSAIVLNENLARHLFGAEDPIGRQLKANNSTFTVVGIARNSKSRTLGEEPADCAYLFMEPRPEDVMSFFGISLAVKTAGNPNNLLQPVRNQIAALDPNLAVFNTETMSEHLDKALLMPRICALLLGVFGGTGLTLAVIGLYGVMSYSVRRRTREFGIRIALGAHARGVLEMVVRQGLGLTSVGLVIGLAIALSVGRFAASLLYGVSGTDLVTFIAVPGVLLAAALVAILVPARRAARVEPMRALRYE
jgi:predicted permease